MSKPFTVTFTPPEGNGDAGPELIEEILHGLSCDGWIVEQHDDGPVGNVYIIRWGVAGEVSTQSVHSTLDGVKAAAMEFIDADGDNADELHTTVANFDGSENLEVETCEDHWLAIEVEELLP